MNRNQSAYPVYHTASPTCEGMTNMQVTFLMMMQSCVMSKPDEAPEKLADWAMTLTDAVFKRLKKES